MKDWQMEQVQFISHWVNDKQALKTSPENKLSHIILVEEA